MVSPTNIREQTLATLRGTRQDMSTSKWLRAVGKKPMEIQREAAFKRLEVEQAILELGNEKLSEISAKLKENETELLEGRADLIAARKNLRKVEEVLGAVSKVLGLISKIIKLPTGL